ncbi:anhydro-N-acetylmuramic acid kinase AnmK [Virgibacillus halodenitrificans]|uniref:anhydro-N-acetylmuramic acid kinase AnmK n=1 Tax=Virgibacillus halodenitrificans TaxID=1482 RepID=UPI000EF441A9|nr:anhydro-N-acetylmuramic acid kinase AnmK [Virgibacillus halodenitrificans]MYL57623.1 anhydro-N-acetylmuramic acid kinase [Virgibacillus halodenitrificans]
MFIVGLMSGTSLDGIDAALIKVEGHGSKTNLEIMETTEMPFNDYMKEKLLQASNKDTSNVEQLCSLNFEISYLYAEAVREVCEKANFPIEQLDLIGSHGQTLYHIPKPGNGLFRSSLQIGDASVLAYETDAMVISNFRSMDIAAGGEGAPLIPYIDYLLFHHKQRGRLLQNIGGIGNVSVVPARGTLKDIIAFDTGPGNMIIDEICRKRLNQDFDKGGELASKGVVNKNLVEGWMNHHFFKKHPPKSTGREDFGIHYANTILNENASMSTKDLIATATYFSAYSIADAYKSFVLPYYQINEIIVSGGGANNSTLLYMLQELLPDQNVVTSTKFGISEDFKEAIGFALLANETYHQQYANVPSATGAKQAVILGQFTLPPRGNKRGN